MKLKLFYISLITYAISLSCEKEVPLIIENTDIPLIIKVISEGKSIIEYSYNDANLLSEEKNKFYYNKHTYNTKNLLIKTDLYADMGLFSSDIHVVETSINRTEWVNPGNTERCGTVTFEYNNKEQLIKTTYHRVPETKSEYSEFSYDGNGRIKRQTLNWDNKISGYIDYFYDGDGNLIKKIRYSVSSAGIAELSTTTDYEFDNMQNPYKSFKRLMIPCTNTNQNNITKETYTLHFEVDDPMIERVKITETSYEYYDNGYPKRLNGTVEYVYK